MKRKHQNRISILLKDQRAMLLRLASIKLRHLAQPHVNFDIGGGTRRSATRLLGGLRQVI